jgi:hypothetical protein
LKKSTSRTPAPLSASTLHDLHNYALAAASAGVSLVALAQPSQAEVVYTPAHAEIRSGGSYGIDLTNNGTVEFTIVDGGSTFFQNVSARPASGNAIEFFPLSGQCGPTYGAAAAIAVGGQIGPGGGSQSCFSVNRNKRMAGWKNQYGFTSYSGEWRNARQYYLGLQFQLSDGTHFGWARASVGLIKKKWRVEITGYAYETVPDTPIKAGQIHGDDAKKGQASAVLSEGQEQFASLGALALGAEGVGLWRREE